jgi:hypothetical protein
MSLNHVLEGTPVPLALEGKSLIVDGDISAVNLSAETLILGDEVFRGKFSYGGDLTGRSGVTNLFSNCTPALVLQGYTPLPDPARLSARNWLIAPVSGLVTKICIGVGSLGAIGTQFSFVERDNTNSDTALVTITMPNANEYSIFPISPPVPIVAGLRYYAQTNLTPTNPAATSIEVFFGETP